MPRSAASLALAVLLALLAVPPASAGADAAPSAEDTLLQEMNRVRSDAGLAVLRRDARLARAARAQSEAILATTVFDHGDFAARLRRFRARGPVLGENLAWGAGSLASPRSIVRAWLRSAPHRANLMRPGFRRVGLAALVGRFGGYTRARVVTADFAGT